jgi:two-component system, LytTR family, response regulator
MNPRISHLKKLDMGAAATNFNDQSITPKINPLRKSQPHKIVVPTQDGLLFVEIQDIVHCDANGIQSRVWLNNGESVIVNKNLKEMEAILQYKFFYRSHASHIINLLHIKKFIRADGGIYMSNGRALSISRHKRQEFLQLVMC